MDVQSYDLAWQDRWDDMKRYGPYSRHVRRFIHKFIREIEFETVLDAGCGQGELLTEIVRLYPHVSEIGGIDFSPISVEVTKKRLGRGHFEVIDLQSQTLDRKYDLVLNVDVLEHIPDDRAAIANLRRMCNKYVLISSVQGKQLPEWEAKVVGHVRNYQRGELQAKMVEAGFEIVRFIEWGFPFYSPLYRRFLTLTGGQGTDGRYGPGRKLLAFLLYQLFTLNSTAPR